MSVGNGESLKRLKQRNIMGFGTLMSAWMTHLNGMGLAVGLLEEGEKEAVGLCRPDEGTVVEEVERDRFEKSLGQKPAGPGDTQKVKEQSRKTSFIICTVIPQYPQVIGFRTPRRYPKSTNASIPYIKMAQNTA